MTEATLPRDRARDSARASTTALHWPEYLIEAGALGAFMLSACVFGTLIWYPASPVHDLLSTPFTQRAVMGVLMGLTAVAINYSSLGKRSGAHLNPAVTLTFLTLGKVRGRDAGFYIAAQFAGGVAGVMIAHHLIGAPLGDPAVRYVVTEPGPLGVAAAFTGELAITFILMSVVLGTAASARWSRFTGLFAGLLVASYITFESPVSGMSMNPARTIGSAVAAGSWTSAWIYFVAPLAGMLLAARLYVVRRGRAAVPCAKMVHGTPCIFCGRGQAG